MNVATPRKLKSPGSVFASIGLQGLMVLTTVLFLIPVLMVLSFSFKTKREVYTGNPLALPESFNFDNYVSAFDKLNFATTFFNTAAYTAVSTVILALLCAAAAWAIARHRGKFFKFSYIYFIIGILIPYQALFLPIYIMGYTLQLTNTAHGIVLMYIATGMPFGVFLMTSFMASVPVELEEAARIDGCSVYRTFFSVVLPLLKVPIATLIIMQAFQTWNDYLMASLFVSDSGLKTLTVAMQRFFSQQTSDYTSAMASIVVAVLPIAILFVALQKYFIKGMTAGAVKG